MLIAYDLGHYPITYDFTGWMVRAEQARQEKNWENLHIAFQPGEDDGFRLKTLRDYQFTKARKEFRLQNLLVPLARLVPSVSEATILREKLDVATPHFNIFNDIFRAPLSPFRATEVAKSAVVSMYPKRYMTITLRQSDVQVERNSRQEQWAKVAKWASKHGLNVVVVPDTEALLQGKKQVVWPTECIPAAMNMDIRLALYEMAQFNCFTSGGPFTLAAFAENVRYATFKLICNGIDVCSPKHMETIGLDDGVSRGSFRTSWWCDDTFENICPKLEPYLDIKYKIGVEDVFKAQTHYRGHLIVQKGAHEPSQIHPARITH